MASYNKYDPRLESLVMETRTLWDPEVANLSAEDKHWLAEQVQRHPERRPRSTTNGRTPGLPARLR